ncbi:MAG: CHAT domain-containing tetratricopeptide repeat protein [Bacteroidales bacterium]
MKMLQTLTKVLIIFYGSMVWAQTDPHSLKNLYQQTLRLYDLTTKGKSLSIIGLSDSLIREYKNFPGADNYLGFLYIYMAEAAKQQGDISLARNSYELASRYFPAGSEILDYQIPVNLLSLDLDAGRFFQCLKIGISLLDKEVFLKDPAKRGTLLNNIADAALESGNLILTDSLFNILFSLIKENVKGDGFDIALAYRNYGLYKLAIGLPYPAKEDIKVALSFYKEKFGESHFQVAKSWQALGKAYKMLCKPDSSLICFEEARKAFLDRQDSVGISDFQRIGIDYETLYLELLIDEIDLQRNIALEFKGQIRENRLFSASSNVTEALNRFASIQQGMICSESGFILADKMRALFDIGVRINLDLFKVSGKDEYLRKALFYSMQSSAISLESKARLDETLMLNDSMRANNLKLYRIRDELERNPDRDQSSQLLQDYISIHKILSPNQFSINNSDELVKKQVNNLLKAFRKRRQLLCFHQIDSTILVFNVLHSKISFSEIPISSSLKQELGKFNTLLTTPQQGNYHNFDILEFSQCGTYLYRILLKPFISVDLTKEILINKDGLLNTVPFEALVIDTVIQNLKTLHEFRELPFVLKKLNLSYTSGFRLTKRTSEPLWHRRTLRFLYCPDDSLAPEINQEAKSLIGKDWNVTEISLGSRMPNLGALLGKSDAIHFSGHVTINRDDSNRSFLSCTQQEHGVFFLSELLNLRINPELVFLNGCESANGQINRGEGMLSPGLYFLLAGAHGVIEHLWKAPDVSSAFLATEFYQAYDGNDAPITLTESKRKYLFSCLPGQDHPHYWAGLIYSSPLILPPTKINLFILIFLLLVFLSTAVSFVFVKNRSFRSE